MKNLAERLKDCMTEGKLSPNDLRLLLPLLDNASPVPTLEEVLLPTFDATVDINIPSTPDVTFPTPITADPPDIGDYPFPVDPDFDLDRYC